MTNITGRPRTLFHRLLTLPGGPPPCFHRPLPTPVTAVAAALALAVLGASPPARAADKGTLLIWINGDKGYEGIAKIAEKFTRDTGVAVKVEHPENAIDKFEQAAAAGKGP